MYGFPFDAGPTGVFYRTDYFEKAGVDPNSIKTWDDYIAAGKKIKEKVGVDLLGLDFNNDDGLFRMTLTQQGTFYFNNKGKLNLTSKEAKKQWS
ncbi:extracellular solute-binding protein [Priestia megaterium]